MFKNLIVYRTDPGWQFPAQVELPAFTPCEATAPASVGFVPPRGAPHLALVESAGPRHKLLRLLIERKQVPAAVVKRRVEEAAAEIEREVGRKPGRRAAAELKDQVLLELLPQAFGKQTAVQIWFDTEQRLLCLDTGSFKAADEALTQLARHFDGLQVKPLHTTRSPAQCMAAWLQTDAPAGFSVDRECELKSADEMKSVVRYARHPLDIEEVQEHVRQGMRPTRLALTWQGRVSFVLTAAGMLKKIEFLDGVLEGQSAPQGEDEFDADAAITTGELSRLLPDLIEALGGEVEGEG